ncbi:MAG: hypothetical protein SGILL_003414 [Bacillariaceae sp.]
MCVESGSSVCEAQEDLNYEDSFTKELICYDGWTDVGLFVYLDDEFTIEECDECHPPSEDVDNVIAYYFEVPCEPICIIPSSAPTSGGSDTNSDDQIVEETDEPTSSPTPAPSTTICVEQAELISTSAPETITETVIDITGPNTDTIDFSVLLDMVQEGNLEEFAVRYLDTNYVEVCEQFTAGEATQTQSFTAACVDNITSVSLFIYVGDDFNLDECNACQAPINGDDDYDAYLFEMPCVPECPPEEPENPDCPEISVTSPDVDGVLGADVISVTTESTESVAFDVSLDVSETAVISVQYQSATEGAKCVHTEDLTIPLPVTAVCQDGWTEVVVSLYLGDEITGTDCDFCQPPPGDSSIEYSTITVEIPCTPCPTEDEGVQTSVPSGSSSSTSEAIVVEQAASSGTSCTDQNVLVDWTGENDMWCEEASLSGVFSVVQSDPLGSTVTFSVRNSLANSANFELQFVNLVGEEDCVDLQSIEEGGTFGETLEASCVDGIATVTLFADNSSHGNSANPNQRCKDVGANTCHVVYQLPCGEGESAGNPCSETARKLGASIEGFVTHDVNSDAGEDGEDGPYCLNQDFPCTGDEANMAYVCHYSTRGGYQTFCIPEVDSDIMRFYANDYCGPCEGWNGETHSGQSI